MKAPVLPSSEKLEKYQTPLNPYIWRGPKTERLYELEEEAHNATRAAAKELGKVLGYSDAAFWTHSLPEALRSQLEGWDTAAAFLAAKSYLEGRGCTVTVPDKVPV